ncbi:MAG: formate--tetrahydrofolate ligase [Deltaproteobacteria bacterium]|jgi:formate--tetrahydrofolate ligase|nr:formate--tetrahydrofolate ligase [Deltaproteobacteria bacterium]
MALDYRDYTLKGAKDYEIAEAAEEELAPIAEVAHRLGLLDEEILPHGRFIAKIDYAAAMERLRSRPNGKYIDVTAITPTPLGEGKSTTTIGLTQGLGKRGLKVSAAIRQPSGGPTMNVKGSAAGGGMSQCLPLAAFSLGLTGDINAVMNAHNLGMVALNARMTHEFNYGDAYLASKGLRRLDIDPNRVEFGFIMDFAAQCLRKIVVGLGGKKDGFLMESRFDIAVSSEIMAILAMATDIKDTRERIGRIVMAYGRDGKPVTAEDLEVAGAMAAWTLSALNPNLLRTMEGQPVLVHAGPFANIALGQSSIVADKLALKLADYHVTESGFGADIGFEKFWNLKCRLSGLIPDAAVLVATARALKCHGGAPIPRPGNPLPPEYGVPNPALVEKGMDNLIHHLKIIQKSGISPVVCVNSFAADSPEELAIIKRGVEALGARVTVSDHWLKGGEGALELADAVQDACREKSDFRFLYRCSLSFRERIETIAKEVYGADGVDFAPEALAKLQSYGEDPKTDGFGVCMVKTHLSLSGDPNLKGVPKGFRLFVRDALLYAGAGLVAPVVGSISLMPGTSSDPAYRKVDVDLATGKTRGLF